MSRALRHIGVVVSKLEEGLRVFQEYLGCELIGVYRELRGEYQSALVGIENVEMNVALLRADDNGRIELLEYVSPPGRRRAPVSANDIGVSHLALTVRSLDDLQARAGEYGVRFLSPPLTSPNGWVKVAYAVVLEEAMVELVEVLDERAQFSGGNPPPRGETK